MEIPWVYLSMMFSIKMFCKIIGQVFLGGVTSYVEKGTLDLVYHPKNLISMLRDLCFLILLFAMLTDV